jgi:hypothetical protein
MKRLILILVMLSTGALAWVDTPNLVGYWRFENGNATDNSGNGNDGTVYGDPTVADGRFGQCYDFNGGGDYVTIDNTENSDFDLTPNQDLSFSAWFNSNNLNTGETILDKRYSSPAGNTYSYGWRVGPSQAIGFLIYYGEYSARYVVTSSSLSPDTWYNCIVTIDRDGNMSMYLDGSLVDSVDISSHSSTDLSTDEELEIGYKSLSGSSFTYFDGKIDELQIFNTALSESDIRRVMISGHPLEGEQ